MAVLPIESGLANWAEIKGVIAKRPTVSAQSLLAATLIEPAWRGLEADDFPLGALVIDDVARGELSQCKKPGSPDEFAFVARHPGPYGECWKVIAGQKSFARQISVWVKVAVFTTRVDLQQKITLAKGLLLAGVGRCLLLWATGSHQGCLRFEQLPSGRAK